MTYYSLEEQFDDALHVDAADRAGRLRAAARQALLAYLGELAGHLGAEPGGCAGDQGRGHGDSLGDAVDTSPGRSRDGHCYETVAMPPGAIP